MSVQKKDAGFYQNARKPVGEDGVAMLERMNGGHHAALAQWGFGEVSPHFGDDMLDLGCGGGANLLRLLALNPTGHVTGADYAQTSVDVSRQTCSQAIEEGTCSVVLADVGQLPFEDAAFDFACAFETIYFWPDVKGALRETFRVLKPGARLMVCNEADGTHEADYDMTEIIEGMNVYAPGQIEGLLLDAGFADVKVHRKKEKSWIVFEATKANL